MTYAQSNITRDAIASLAHGPAVSIPSTYYNLHNLQSTTFNLCNVLYYLYTFYICYLFDLHFLRIQEGWNVR